MKGRVHWKFQGVPKIAAELLASNHHTQSEEILREDPVAEGEQHHDDQDQRRVEAGQVHVHTGGFRKTEKGKRALTLVHLLSTVK